MPRPMSDLRIIGTEVRKKERDRESVCVGETLSEFFCTETNNGR